MAARTDDSLAELAIKDIEGLAKRFDVHLDKQEKVNEKHSEKIVDLEKAHILHGGRVDLVYQKMDQVHLDIGTIISKLDKSPNAVREWIGTATPYILIGGGLIYFYVTGGKS